MDRIGEKIRSLRSNKGLSQEELADQSAVNLRTIQRIERGITKPRSSTLKLILNALGVRFEDISKDGTTDTIEDKKEIFFYLHLSVLSFVFMPFGNIILPYLLWKKYKDKIDDFDEVSINLIDYQILWSIFYYLSAVMLLAPLILKQNMIHPYYIP